MPFVRCLFAAVGALALGFWLSLPARAQLVFSLTPNPASGAPGQTISFLGSLTNVGSEIVSIEGVAANISGPDPTALVWDDTSFLAGLPLELSIGGSYSETLLLQILPAAVPGSYLAAYSVQGTGQSSGEAFSGSDSVPVTVTGASTIAPEPGAIVLLLSGMGAICRQWRRR